MFVCRLPFRIANISTSPLQCDEFLSFLICVCVCVKMPCVSLSIKYSLIFIICIDHCSFCCGFLKSSPSLAHINATWQSNGGSERERESEKKPATKYCRSWTWAAQEKRVSSARDGRKKRSVNTINVYIKIYRFEHNKEKGMAWKKYQCEHSQRLEAARIKRTQNLQWP